MGPSNIGHYLILLLFMLMISYGLSKRNFMVKVNDIKCTSRSDIINVTCTETKSNRVAGLNMFVWLTEDINQIRYNLDVSHFDKNGQWENFFKFSNLDVCEFLSAKFTVPILLITRNIMRKFSNFPEECPIKKNVFYYIQRMRIDPEQFPPYFPEGKFSATGMLFNDKMVYLDYALEIQIVSKKNKPKIR